MAGTLLPLIPKRVFDFGALANSTTLQFPLVERIDVSRYIDCMVALRVHAASITTLNSLVFDLYGDGFTTEDPGLLFRTSSPLATQSVTAATPLLLTYGATVRGEFVTFILTATKAVAGNLSATVSVDLVLRTPDEVEDDY
jgi:hypothetical protein